MGYIQSLVHSESTVKLGSVDYIKLWLYISVNEKDHGKKPSTLFSLVSWIVSILFTALSCPNGFQAIL